MFNNHFLLLTLLTGPVESVWLSCRVRQDPSWRVCMLTDTEGGHGGLGSEERKGDSSTVPVPAAHLSPQLGWLHLSLSVSTLAKKWRRGLVAWGRSQPWEGMTSSCSKESKTHNFSLGTRKRSHLLREAFSLPHHDRKWLNQLWPPTFYCKGVSAGTISTNFLIKLDINRLTW